MRIRDPTAQPSSAHPLSPSIGAVTAAPTLGLARSAPATLLDRLRADPRRRRVLRWAAPALVLLLAAVARLWNLGEPHSLVFDETFYVKDAWTLLHLGYEGDWPDDANAAFEAGDVDGYSSDPSYVAHPPLGKWFIALGLAAFGAENAAGWRIATALAGVLLVALTMVVAKLLWRSTVLACVAGLVLAIDGGAIVLSRVALLDVFLALLGLLGATFVLLDRRWARQRLERWLARRDGRSTDWGPTFWWRPWLLAAGVAFGLASGVKWSGLYLLAVFAVYSVVSDMLDRRRAGVHFWFTGTVAGQGLPSFLLTVPAALAAYLVTWTGWLVTSGGYYRGWSAEAGNAWTGALSWVPLPLQSLWHYHDSVYRFHVGLAAEHGYASPAWQWPLLLRPTSMHYEAAEGGGTAALITSLPNPLLWWGGFAAMVWLLYRLIRSRDRTLGLPLVGLAATWLPWLLYPERTMFQFYGIAFQPYLALAIAAVAGAMLATPAHPVSRRQTGERILLVLLIAALAISAFFYPVWTGIEAPIGFLRAHYWLPGWI